jgi:hypothetical protein
MAIDISSAPCQNMLLSKSFSGMALWSGSQARTAAFYGVLLCVKKSRVDLLF